MPARQTRPEGGQGRHRGGVEARRVSCRALAHPSLQAGDDHRHFRRNTAADHRDQLGVLLPPMIFEQSGIGTNAAFMQAVFVGLVNVVFTVVAMALIDRFGRRPLLGFGLSGIAVCMLLLAYGFGRQPHPRPGSDRRAAAEIDHQQLAALVDRTYDSDTGFREAVTVPSGRRLQKFEPKLVGSAIAMNPKLVSSPYSVSSRVSRFRSGRSCGSCSPSCFPTGFAAWRYLLSA